MALNRADQNWPTSEMVELVMDDTHTGDTIEQLIEDVDDVLYPPVLGGESFIDWLVRTR